MMVRAEPQLQPDASRSLACQDSAGLMGWMI